MTGNAAVLSGRMRHGGPPHGLVSAQIAIPGNTTDPSEGRQDSLAQTVRRFEAVNAMAGSTSQAARNVRYLRAFLVSCGARELGDVTTVAIESWEADLLAAGYAPKTVLNKWAAVSAFCSFLVRAKLLPSNPCATAVRPVLEEEVPIRLSRAEANRCVQIAQRHGRACEIGLAIYTGLRAEELRRLEWRDVDLQAGHILVRKSKSKHPRRVPICAEARALLVRQHARFGAWRFVFPSGRRDQGDGSQGRGCWSRAGPRGLDWWHRVCLQPVQEALAPFRTLPKGSAGRGWHLLRHTFCSLLAEAGLTEKRIADWAGHRDVRTTRRYIHFAPGYDPQIEKLNLGGPAPAESERTHENREKKGNLP